MVKTECQKKTQLHFGGGECAGVQIIGKGRVRVFITSPGGGDITLFRLLEGDVSILSAACMLNGMDVELDMEMETDQNFIRFQSVCIANCMMRAEL